MVHQIELGALFVYKNYICFNMRLMHLMGVPAIHFLLMFHMERFGSISSQMKELLILIDLRVSISSTSKPLMGKAHRAHKCFTIANRHYSAHGWPVRHGGCFFLTINLPTYCIFLHNYIRTIGGVTLYRSRWG